MLSVDISFSAIDFQKNTNPFVTSFKRMFYEYHQAMKHRKIFENRFTNKNLMSKNVFEQGFLNGEIVSKESHYFSRNI